MVTNLKTYSQKKSKTICMQCFVSKLQTQYKKIKKELQGTRLIWPLTLTAKNNLKELDLKRALACPHTSVPLTFAHIDGLKYLLTNQLSSVISRCA